LDIVLATRLRPPPLWPDLEASSAPPDGASFFVLTNAAAAIATKAG